MGNLVTPQVKTVVNDIKAGWRTSEFWVHLVIQVLTWVTVYDANTQAAKMAGAGLSVVALLGYTASRTLVKSANGAGQTTTTLGATVQAVEQKVAAAENKVAAIVEPVVSDVVPPAQPQQ